MDSNLSSDIDNLQKLATQLDPNNERERLNALNLARSILARLETPHESIMRMIYHEPALFMATKVLSDLGIFRQLSKSILPLSAGSMAQNATADPRLVERLLKHVATARFIDETGPDTYSANAITKCCATPAAKGAIDDMFQTVPVVGAMPEFLRDSGYVNPVNKDRTAWKVAYNTDLHFFEHLNMPGREEKLEALRNHMDFKTVGLRWFEMPDLVDALFSNVKSEEVAVVDVGGSGGHDLLAFREAKSTMPGRLILQDLPTTLESLDVAMFAQNNIEIMGHDFFTPQSVHGARVYYSKMCLHDWPDKQCAEILKQLRSAMTPGYSRIVLDEIIVPDEGAGWFETSVDLLMMEVHSAQERREREWRALVEEVEGLRIRRIWDLEGSVNKIIEIEAL